jgi:hypothetical protein
MAMKLIIEARVESKDAESQRGPIRLAVIERDDDDLEHLGFSPEDCKTILALGDSVKILSRAGIPFLALPKSRLMRRT